MEEEQTELDPELIRREGKTNLDQARIPHRYWQLKPEAMGEGAKNMLNAFNFLEEAAGHPLPITTTIYML